MSSAVGNYASATLRSYITRTSHTHHTHSMHARTPSPTSRHDTGNPGGQLPRRKKEPGPMLAGCVPAAMASFFLGTPNASEAATGPSAEPKKSVRRQSGLCGRRLSVSGQCQGNKSGCITKSSGTCSSDKQQLIRSTQIATTIEYSVATLAAYSFWAPSSRRCGRDRVGATDSIGRSACMSVYQSEHVCVLRPAS